MGAFAGAGAVVAVILAAFAVLESRFDRWELLALCCCSTERALYLRVSCRAAIPKGSTDLFPSVNPAFGASGQQRRVSVRPEEREPTPYEGIEGVSRVLSSRIPIEPGRGGSSRSVATFTPIRTTRGSVVRAVNSKRKVGDNEEKDEDAPKLSPRRSESPDDEDSSARQAKVKRGSSAK